MPAGPAPMTATFRSAGLGSGMRLRSNQCSLAYFCWSATKRLSTLMPTGSSTWVRRQAISQKRTHTRPQVAAMGYFCSTTPTEWVNLPSLM